MSRFLAILLVLTLTGACIAQTLPGTTLWEPMGDPAPDMVAGIHRFLDRETVTSRGRREARWPVIKNEADLARDNEHRRERLAKPLGLVDQRAEPSLRSAVGLDQAEPISSSAQVRVRSVAWKVFDDVEMYGWLLEPTKPDGTLAITKGDVVFLIDADADIREMLEIKVGANVPPTLPRGLAEAGLRVLIPTLIDRGTGWAGDPKIRRTNVSHREWLYRMAFETGRHPIGYEVEAVRAAIDWLLSSGPRRTEVGLVGFGEGGRVALYAAAMDTRVSTTWVVDGFGPRESTWSEPIDRNLQGILEEFGDAEVASLVYPRPLLIGQGKRLGSRLPPPMPGQLNFAAPGVLKPVTVGALQDEFDRISQITIHLPAKSFLPTGEPVDPLTYGQSERPFLALFLPKLVESPRDNSLTPKNVPVSDPVFDPSDILRRQLSEWVNHTQTLLRKSELRRAAKWAHVKTSEFSEFVKATEPLRDEFWSDVIGKFPEASELLKVRSKKIMDELKFIGYAIEIPVWPDVVASGVLLLPKDLRVGEKRPVVVCQHGLEGTPDPVVNPKVKSVYNSYGAELADRGYIVYAPQNPYIGQEQFRSLQRKAQPLGKTLFAIIVRQHERTLQWLKTLSSVDGERIAFYGLSYGGKTAMRVPALLPDYCLSICSADFNEWVVKCTNIDRPYSYMYTNEHDMYEWNLAEGFNYAEMAALIAPRPFMVERGHLDGVAPDEWVGYEYAKVRRLYSALGIPERTEIGYFPNGHQIDGKATFAFLAKHLNWPRAFK